MDAHHRSKEAPMDFQFTSRPSTGVKPIWAESQPDESDRPRKRRFTDLNSASPALPAVPPPAPVFGGDVNVPFLFQNPAPPNRQPPYPWDPPSHFSPERAFPQREHRDVDMPDLPVGPSRAPEGEGRAGRAVAMGGLRRLFRSRQKVHARPPPRRTDEGPEQKSEDGVENDGLAGPSVQHTTNHYVLHIPPDISYMLQSFLRFFFNLALALVILYSIVQFILAFQRDVEHQSSRYSMDIVREIGVCAMQFKNNYCDTKQIPAMMHQCAVWETCMNRDPTTVSKTRIGAELIAEIINAFTTPMSSKSQLLLFLALLLVVYALLSLHHSHHPPPH